MQELRDDEFGLLRGNLERVRERIALAAERSGRRPEDIQLIAVTKKVDIAVCQALLDLGVETLGESRPEVLAEKAQILDESTQWHMIGHFQSKKIGKSLPHLAFLHSVHNLDLLSRLDLKAKEQNRSAPLPLLIQVNLSAEPSKQGFFAEDAGHAAELASAFSHLEARGFMTMAPQGANERELHEIFARLRTIRDEAGIDRFPELSMGMTNDFEEAITEGATMVRIGTALFDGLQQSR
ncbi:MAG: YggS family pyridoxal phosphate-dependent enzyme [Planctomycetota bacterium]